MEVIILQITQFVGLLVLAVTYYLKYTEIKGKIAEVDKMVTEIKKLEREMDKLKAEIVKENVAIILELANRKRKIYEVVYQINEKMIAFWDSYKKNLRSHEPLKILRTEIDKLIFHDMLLLAEESTNIADYFLEGKQKKREDYIEDTILSILPILKKYLSDFNREDVLKNLKANSTNAIRADLLSMIRFLENTKSCKSKTKAKELIASII